MAIRQGELNGTVDQQIVFNECRTKPVCAFLRVSKCRTEAGNALQELGRFLAFVKRPTVTGMKQVRSSVDAQRPVARFVLRQKKWIAPNECRHIAAFSPDVALFDKQVLVGMYANHGDRTGLLVFTK